MKDEHAERWAALTAAATEAPVPEGFGRWQALFAVEGVTSQDSGFDRVLGPGSLEWPNLPLPLFVIPPFAEEGHADEILIGAVTEIRREGANLVAEGVFSSTEPAAMLIIDLVDSMPWGMSVELANDSWEILVGADGTERHTLVNGNVQGMSATTHPALGGTWIRLLLDEPEPVPAEEVIIADIGAPVTAAGFPTFPPAAWFEKPDLPELTPFQVDPETGRAFGHLAGDTCHIGYADFCVKVGQMGRDFGFFNRKHIPVEGGKLSDFRVGQVTMTGGHAPLNFTAGAAVQHYDDSRSAKVDVVAYWDDVHGAPVLAGAARPDVTPEDIRVLNASSLSGDWRPINGQRELVAALCVNVPGFPIIKALAASAAGDDIGAIILGPIVAAPAEPVIKAAGLAVKAKDTGRVLLHQRRLDDDTAPGKWEFPGGWLEEGEDPFDAARREFGEETGIALPDGKIVHSEVTEDYIQFVYLIDEEFEVTGGEDETGRNVCAWFNPDEMNPRTPTSPLRDEAIQNDWDAIAAVGQDDEELVNAGPLAAAAYGFALRGLVDGLATIERADFDTRLQRVAAGL